jgi:hypothetical protein
MHELAPQTMMVEREMQFKTARKKRGANEETRCSALIPRAEACDGGLKQRWVSCEIPHRVLAKRREGSAAM